ncbi:MAG: acyltransferase family protein [Candidatus Humimicrobiaceae bacterium]
MVFPKKRITYIDNLKILLISLVIVGHVSVTYGLVGFWYYYERTVSASSIILTFFTSFLQTFLIGFFLFLAAYFIPQSYSRKGPGKYLTGRLKRLGIPLIFYILFIGPLVLYLHELVINKNNIDFFKFYWKTIIKNGIINVGPLWFLEVLLIFTITYLILRQITDTMKTEKKKKAATFPSNSQIFLFIIIISLLSFTIRIWFPVTSTVGTLQLSFLIQYIALFSIGILTYHHNWLEKITARIASFWLWITLIALPFWLLLAFFSKALSGDLSLIGGGLHWQSLAYSFWENIVGIGIIINLVYLFRKKFNHQNKLLKIVSKSTYAALIIHPLILVPLSYLLRGINLDPLVKFLLVTITGIPLCFLFGNYIRKIPGLKSML